MLQHLTLPAPAHTHAVVVGGGIMGADVALVLARAGCHTTVVEQGQTRRAALPAYFETGLKQLGAERSNTENVCDGVCVPAFGEH